MSLSCYVSNFIDSYHFPLQYTLFWGFLIACNKINSLTFMVFTPRSLLRMGYCRQPTRTSVRTYVRTSVPKIFDFKWYFWFFGTITSVVLEDFKNFWKKWFFGQTTPFFTIFTPQSLLRMGYCRHYSYIRTYVRQQKFLISNDIFVFLAPLHQ